MTLSTKGQIVLPVQLRRLLGLRARSKLIVEERDGGIFIRPARTGRLIEPIAYLPPASIHLSADDCALMDGLTGEDETPDS